MTHRTMAETLVLAQRLKILLLSNCQYSMSLGEIVSKLGISAPETLRLLKHIGAVRLRYGQYIYTPTELDYQFAKEVQK
jgi:hypothetical protein